MGQHAKNPGTAAVLSLLIPGSHYLIVIRILRVLRIFRLFKLAHYVGEGNVLLRALRASRRKIAVFLTAVLSLLIIIGALMYLIEGEENGFTDIPTSIYWAVVTLTTVGYGDMTPVTPMGRTIAVFLMACGLALLGTVTGSFGTWLLQVFSREDEQRPPES